MITVDRKKAVALLVALGFQKAKDWDDDKLVEKLALVPSKAGQDEVPKEHADLVEQLGKAAGSGDIELVGAGDASQNEEEAPRVRSGSEDGDGKRGKRTSKVDRAVDKAAKAKAGKESKSTGRSKPAARSSSSKDKDDDKEAKSEREVDEFGATIGSIRSKINQALSSEWQTEEAIAEEAGVTLKQARSRLRRMKRKGLAEAERSVSYRLASKKGGK